MNFLSQHIPFETLADLAEGRAQAAGREAEHLSSCQNCSSQLTSLAETVRLMRADDAEAAPQSAVAYAINLFRQRAARTVPEPSRLRRVLAALSFDSAGLTPAFGLRSGATAARQLLYSAGENDLDVRVAATPEGAFVLSGQLLGPCGAGRVELVGADDSAEAPLDERCEFVLPPVAAGTYTLRVSLAGAALEVPELELRA